MSPIIYNVFFAISSNIGIDILNMSSCITMDSRCQLVDSMYQQYQKIIQDFTNANIQLQNRYL